MKSLKPRDQWILNVVPLIWKLEICENLLDPVFVMNTSSECDRTFHNLEPQNLSIKVSEKQKNAGRRISTPWIS